MCHCIVSGCDCEVICIRHHVNVGSSVVIAGDKSQWYSFVLVVSEEGRLTIRDFYGE